MVIVRRRELGLSVQSMSAKRLTMRIIVSIITLASLVLALLSIIIFYLVYK